MARPAGKDEDALADRVRDLPILEASVLHRRKQVLQPFQFLRIELVPEDEWRVPLKSLVAHLMEQAEKFFRLVELRQVELEDGDLFAEDCPRQLLDTEGLAGTGCPKDGDRQRLVRRDRPGVICNQSVQAAEVLDLAP